MSYINVRMLIIRITLQLKGALKLQKLQERVKKKKTFKHMNGCSHLVGIKAGEQPADGVTLSPHHR